MLRAIKEQAMQEQQQGKGWTPIQDAKVAAHIALLAARALASPLEVMLRTGFGSRYFGLPSLLALFAVPMWMLFWPEHDPRPIIGFWLLFLVMQLRARLETVRMLRRGVFVHTSFNGRSRLAAIFRRMPEVRIKGEIEPWLAVIAGMLALGFSQPLGSYLMVAGFSLGLVAGTIESVERARALSMNDARIEQQSLAERFREMQRGG